MSRQRKKEKYLFLNKFVVYCGTIKLQPLQKNKTMKTLNAIQKLAKAYGLTELFENAAAAIKEGATFNGTVYSKKDGKHRMCLSVYLDGKYTHLGSVENEDVNKFKNVFTGIETTISTTSNYGTIGWWVNGMIGE